MRNFEIPGRSTVHSRTAMAATSHVVATSTAISILQRGGNAMDAAVAACAVQCVVEPESTGIGGDCFCMYSPEGSDDMIAFNGSGRAPAGATIEWFQAQGITAIERQSPHAITVPGAVDAWDRLIAAHGSMHLAELLQPAIDLARNGYVVAPRVAYDWESQKAILARDPNTARRFLPNGRPLRAGEVHHQPELADTLQKIGNHGRDAFYKGAVADDIVSYLQSLGGLHTHADFATASGEFVTPMRGDFRGYDVCEVPPNGQGVVALLLLNIMKGYDTAGVDPLSVDRLHLEIEAAKLAFRDRNAFVADPAMSDIPIERLLSEDYAAELRDQIDINRANTNLPAATIPRHPDTVYITVVDKDRNVCSFINTLFSGFGSGRLAPKSGVMLTNRGQGFTLQAGHPNCIAPGKRPMHTIIPGMLAKDGKVQMSFGVMGGHYQPFGHMHLLSRHLDFGLDLQEAMDLPRLFKDPANPHVDVESGMPDYVIEGLRAKGHIIKPTLKPLGGSQAIVIDWDHNTLIGASDPRKDGAAIGY